MRLQAKGGRGSKRKERGGGKREEAKYGLTKYPEKGGWSAKKISRT